MTGVQTCALPIFCNVEGYLVDVQLHHVGIGVGQRERRADAAGRADGTEQICVLVTLISRLGGSCATLGPLADETILLADPRLVLKPDFDLPAFGYAREVRAKRPGPVFLKAAMVSPSCIGCFGLALI